MNPAVGKGAIGAFIAKFQSHFVETGTRGQYSMPVRSLRRFQRQGTSGNLFSEYDCRETD